MAADKPHRLEFRLSGITALSGYVVAIGPYSIWTANADSLTFTNPASWSDSIDGSPLVSGLTGATDLLIRVQRDPSVPQIMMEVCVTETGVCRSATRAITLAADPWLKGTFAMPEGTNGKLAFLRWYNNLVPIGTRITPWLSGTPEYADWEFEGNLTDAGPYSLALWGTGSVTYSATPTYLPACNAGSQLTMRAGSSQALDATRSYPVDGGATLTYFWQQLAGPSTLKWSSRTSATPTITGAQFGQYDLQLTVTDGSGGTSTCTVSHGAVATDSNGVVVYGDSRLRTVIGDLIRYGASPWPYSDLNAMEWADKMTDWYGTPNYDIGWQTALSGTVSIAHDSSTIVGTDTAFTTEVCGVSPAYVLIWDARPEGGHYYSKASVTCTDDTHMTITGGVTCGTYEYGHTQWCRDAVSGVQYSVLTNAQYGFWYGQSSNINYYDNVLALYTLYYRTGLTKHLTAARWLRDNFWAFRSYGDEDAYGYAPRLTNLIGLIVGAFDSDADPNVWTWLDRLMRTSMLPTTYINYYPGSDIRESGYNLVYRALMALYHPTPASKAKWQTVVQNSVAAWKLEQFSDGAFRAISAPHGSSGTHGIDDPVTVTHGSKVVTSSATPFQASWFTNCVGGTWCYFWTAPAHIAPPEEYPGWAGPEFGSLGDTTVYKAKYVSSSELELDIPYEGATESGKYWAMSGSATGLGTWVGRGVQPFMEGVAVYGLMMAAKAMDGYDSGAKADAEQMALDAANWLVANGVDSSMRGYYYGVGFSTCADPEAGGATYGCAADRTLFTENAGALSRAYAISGSDMALKAAIDNLFSASWGKLGGPGSDSEYDEISDWALTLGITAWPSPAKWQGYYHGNGGSALWPAARIGGLAAAQSRTARIGFSLPAGAAKARFTSTAPTGADTQTTCTSSPCAVTMDARQGNHLVLVEYLTSGDAVMARGERAITAVQ